MRTQILLAGILSTLLATSAAHAARALGVDVSDWQNQNPGNIPIDWATAHKPVAQGGGGIDFAFIRASRGGTTGTYNELARTGTLANRYDDFAFEYNITNAKAAGVLAGPYHFGRPDIVTYVNGSGQTVVHNGTDEANHFLQQAGPWIKPGFLRPVYDLEAGAAQRSTASLSQFAIDFANRVHEVTGVWPIVYINSNYAINEVNSSVASTYKDLWFARWPSNPDIQNGDPPPASGYPNEYGVWNPSYPTIPNPQPWAFWQYTSTGHPKGIVGDQNGNTDLDVAHGDVDYVKDFLVPAMWTKNVGGSWTTISNWNTDKDPSGKGPAARLPGGDDTIVLDRPSANVIVTLASGTQSMRRLVNNETLAVSGGSLSSAKGTFNGGAITQNAGTINLGPVSGPGNITVSGGVMNATKLEQKGVVVQSIGKITVAAGDNVARVKSLVVKDAGKLDLNDNDLVIDYDGASGFASILAAVQRGYSGKIDPTKTGILSTKGQIAGGRTILALVDNAALAGEIKEWPVGSGRAVDSSSIIGKYTFVGDASMDGLVGEDDYAILDSNLGKTVPLGASWLRGDMTYDGKVGAADFAIVDAQYGLGAGNALFPSMQITMSPASLQAVPEPSAILTIGALLILAVHYRGR